MTLEQLRIFVVVAERLHMTQAAAVLNMAQSAVSAAIQALETSVGMRLFNRVGRRIELAAAGKVLLPEAKAVLRRVAQAEQALADLQGLLRGHLAIWASQTIAGYWLPRFVDRFHEAHAQVSVALMIGNTAQVARAVLEGDADLGFVEGDVDDPLLVPIEVGTDELVLVVGPHHPWATKKALVPGDLAATTWVLRERGSGTRQVFEDALRAYGLTADDLKVALELPSNEAVCSAVEAGRSATVISRLAVAARMTAGALVEMPLRFPERRFLALRHGDRHRSRAEAAFLELIKAG
jgi:DNA-binding transcriptional LysR family regulator